MPESSLSVAPPVVIPYEDGDMPLHTDERPFCADSSCPCHIDESLIQRVLVDPFMDGLLTNEEGLRLMTGQQV